MKKVLITGTAGFIGFHLARRLVDQGYQVTGLDIINDYYDVELKYSRLELSGIFRDDISYNKLVSSSKHPNYNFIKLKLEDRDAIFELFKSNEFDVVVNLAAQAGVRYSLTHPQVYLDSNITGFLNILEACRLYPVENLIYASSSSVYGLNKAMPFQVSSNVDHPVSLYAASKKSNELMAHAYSHLYNIPTTGLRFFTVYGPWGRPDMAPMLFADAISKGKPINVFNNGKMQRDFTYIDDIVEGVVELALQFKPDREVKAEVFNIGNSEPVKLMDFIGGLEKEMGEEATKNFMPMQDGDVKVTYADASKLQKTTGYKPTTSLNAGLHEFVSWYKSFYNL